MPNEGEPQAFRNASYVKSTIVAKYIEGQEVWVIFQKPQNIILIGFQSIFTVLSYWHTQEQ